MSNAPQAVPAGPVVLESVHEGIALLVMNRPERLNSAEQRARGRSE